MIKIFIYLYMIIYFFNINLTYLRLQGIFNMAIYTVPLFAILKYIMAIVCLRKMTFPKNKELKLLVILLFFNLILGFFYENRLIEIVVDFFNYFTFFILVESDELDKNITEKDLKFICKIIMYSCFLAIVIFNLFSAQVGSGLFSITDMFPIVYLEKIKLFLYIIILLFGMRRSILICLIIFILLKIKEKKKKMYIVLLSSFIIFGIYSTEIYKENKVWRVIYYKSIKAVDIIKNPKDYIIGNKQDGRIEEVKYAYLASKNNFITFLIGNGLGFEYKIFHEDKEIIKKKYTHYSNFFLF